MQINLSSILIKIKKTAKEIKNLSNTVAALKDDFHELKHRLKILQDASVLEAEKSILLDEKINELSMSTLSKMNRFEFLEDLVHELKNTRKIIAVNNQENLADDSALSPIWSNNHEFDRFYIEFENRFRGDENLIYKRLKTDHLKRFKKDKNPVLDIGCGRGEFLQLLKDHGIDAVGVDLNSSMINRCKKKGLEAIAGNAVDYMLSSKKRKFSAITGFHIVEHIPHEDLMRLFEACYSALNRGGFVLFETPNPENLIVGACQFYYDPSHLKPIPPQVLKFMLEFVGFRAEIIRLHPLKTDFEAQDKNLEEVYKYLFGAMDYAVLGFKD